MRHNLRVTIELDLINLDFEEYMIIQKRFMDKMLATIPESMSFEELDKILFLNHRKYFPCSIEFDSRAIENDEYSEFEPKTTKIEIRG